MKRGGFTLVELLVVIVIISLLAALLLPAILRALCSGRQGAASHLIDGLSQASEMYYQDTATYPPGNGSGTASLAAALQSWGPKKQAYFEFKADMLDPSGDVVSPVGSNEVLYFKNQRVNWPGNLSDASAHNKQSFDFWCRDCAGDPLGINNWGGN